MSRAFEVLCGAKVPLEGVCPPPLRPFDEKALAFLSDLSASIMSSREARAYPDVVTYAYFLRAQNLKRLMAPYMETANRLGRGLVFHIAPSNVPINFAYSLSAALLAGNASVVKASSRDFPQTRMVCAHIESLLRGAHEGMRPYVTVVTYPRENQEVTEAFSALCDARVIWGGDGTIARVRQAPLPPRAFDITFADRYSLLVCGAKGICAMDEKRLQSAARGFYNDTYLSDQNACTSPRLIYWLGNAEDVAAARKAFWSAVRGYAAARYEIPAVMAVDKLTSACRAAIELEGARFEKEPDNLLTRVSVSALTSAIEAARCPGGFFVEYESETLDALKNVVNTRYQTMSCLGLDKGALRAFVTDNRLRGIDRVTDVGRTMDFSLVWDGYDLIYSLSRAVDAI